MTRLNAEPKRSDEALATEAQNGSEAAFRTLTESFSTRVYDLCRQILGNPDDAKDACQETFIRLWSKLDRYDTTRSFAPWILKMATNVALNMLRERRRVPLAVGDGMWAEIPAATDASEAIEEQLLSSAKLSAAIQLLRPQDRALLAYRFQQNLTGRQISEITGIPEGSVKVYIFRILANLRKRIREMETQK
jgi:RNA polymerase sigma-70 factor (ECF subfamily)